MMAFLAAYWPVLLASGLPLVVYILVGLSKKSRAVGIDDYFIYSQQVSAQDYANTSVGYALQMAAIFLFAYWAILFGIGALWTALFWGLGFWLLKKLLPRFIPFHDHPTTLHQYLATSFRAGRSFQRVAAVATILGLWGTMMAELDYTTQIYTPLVSNAWYTYGLQAAFLLFGVVYIIANGYKAEVNTERLQVPFAYAALITVLVLTLPSVWVHSGSKAYTIIFVLFQLTLVTMIVAKFQMSWKRPLRDKQVWIPILGVAGLWAVHVWLHSNSSGPLTPGANATILDVPIKTQLYAQGYFGLLSLFIANVLWMPVDFSTWQRIASVEGTGTDALQRLRRGTWRVMLESPASWCLGAILGLIIQGGGFLSPQQDASEGLMSFSQALVDGSAVRTLNWAKSLLYPLFIVASLSIMLSTVDSIISSIAYTAHQDLVQPTEKRLRSAKKTTVIIMLAGLIIYPLLRLGIGANLPTFLYAAYSSQLSLFVVILLALYKKRLEKRAAWSSVVGGFVATIISAGLAVKVNTPETQVLPPIFAVLGALIGYVLGFDRRAADVKSL